MVFCFLFFQQEKEGPAGVWGRFPRGAGEMSRSDKGGRRACARPEPPPTPGPARSKKYPCWGFGDPPNRVRHYASKNSALSGQDTPPGSVKPKTSKISAPLGQSKKSPPR